MVRASSRSGEILNENLSLLGKSRLGRVGLVRPAMPVTLQPFVQAAHSIFEHGASRNLGILIHHALCDRVDTGS